jgi:2-polyprenyl-3-methyl-5-hydroxy-6-metoxy-1,4-benzoquinol methylase
MTGSIATATLDYSEIYDPDTDVDAIYTTATGRRIAAALKPGDAVLELGCATGLMTTLLAGARRRVLAVDRSAPYLARLEARALPGVTALLADVEQVAPEGRFDHVVMTNLLHELDDPGALLDRARAWLMPGGRIHVTLPNPRSLHRLVAFEMGLIERLDERSERGTRFGTRRMLDLDALIALAAASRLRAVDSSGILLKPLPNAQMATLDPAVLTGFERAARHLPGYCAMSYLVLEVAHD